MTAAPIPIWFPICGVGANMIHPQQIPTQIENNRCWHCGGSGETLVTAFGKTVKKPCWVCDGAGEIVSYVVDGQACTASPRDFHLMYPGGTK